MWCPRDSLALVSSFLVPSLLQGKKSHIWQNATSERIADFNLVWSTEPIPSVAAQREGLMLPLLWLVPYSNKFPYWKLWPYHSFLDYLPTCSGVQGHPPIGRLHSFILYFSVVDYTASVVPIKFPQTDSLASVWRLTTQSLRFALKWLLTISDPVFFFLSFFTTYWFSIPW